MTGITKSDRDLQRQTILDFIASKPIGVVCTLDSKGNPQAAAMAVSQTDQLELIFQTPITTRKYANLQHDNRVAIVFGWDVDEFITVQYEGRAREVTTDAERAKCVTIHVGKNPHSAPYANLSDNKFFIITPARVRYSNIADDIHFEI